MKTAKYAFAIVGGLIGGAASYAFYGASLTPDANTLEAIGNLSPAIFLTGACAITGREIAKNIYKTPHL